VSTGNGSPDVFDYTLPGTPRLVSGHADYSEVDPAWSPDGASIVYVSTATGGGDLYLYRVSDKQVTRLTTREGADAAPTWLRDGRIVYQAWLSSSVVELRWLDPADPTRTGVIPVPAGGGRIDRPYAVPF
jgi:Tol biopolymer transport system component